VTPDQLKVMRAIEACRTEVLGGHLDVCDTCGYSRPSYNSCRDRHCPKCQSLAQAKWVEDRLERLLPVHYFHVVFTVPPWLRPIFRGNARAMFDLLFASASKTLLKLGEDAKRLGAQLGITAVLHTWTRELDYHPHLHCIVTGGGLWPDGTKWVEARRKYLFPVKVMAKLFRGLFLDGLRKLHAAGEIVVDADFGKLVDSLYRTDWVVYAKRPFGGPDHVFKYLGRYTHRVGISNQRLISLDERGVTFATKNGRTVTLEAQEFIRRFLQHVLPSGYVKKRHFGLWAAGNVTTRLAVARSLLSSVSPPKPAVPAAEVRIAALDFEWQRRLLRLTGIDVTRCPRCISGRMIARPLTGVRVEARDTS
jgi:predicted Zn-ribbon and HTH transcriptional regulator